MIVGLREEHDLTRQVRRCTTVTSYGVGSSASASKCILTSWSVSAAQVVILQDQYAVGQRVDMIVSPARLPHVVTALTQAGLNYDDIDSDIQKYEVTS